jgi:hypothetical protein
VDSNIFELIIQTDNGTLEIRGTRSEMTDLFNALLTSRKNNEHTLVLNTPSGCPMMFNPLQISHMAISAT